MKLQNGIVLGGRNLALFVCLAMLSGAYADDLTPMYGKASGTAGSIQAAITWYSDAAFTSTEGVITPWQTGSNTCRYVIIEASKMQANSAFPDVPVCFGSDSVSKSYNFGCNVTLTFPQLTIYSGTFMANSDHANGTILKGNCSFVKTPKSIKFAPSNVNSKAVRGWNLAGTYESASDVSVQIGMTFSGDGTGTGFFDCSGDFSSFKGRFYMPEKVPDKGDNVGYFEVRLTSPTALGDTSFPRTDAFLLKHRTHITMADNVVQDGTRGITLSLSDGDFACLNAASGKAWTLKAPLYGSTGTLKKVGAGTVTLAGPVEIKDIVVTNGTLVVAPGATFPADGHITVKAGGKLVSRVGTNLPVPYTLEEGGLFAFDFTVPYEDGATTALDCTNMTAEAYALLSKPIEVGLSQTIPLPVNATQELACVRFPSGLVQVADFTNVTAKTAFGLPNAWFKVVSDAEHGEDVLTLVVKPAIDRTGPDVYRPFTTQYTYSRTTSAYTDTPVWSDGLAAHAGADYIHTNGCEFWSWDGYDNNTRTFPGDSLYLTGEFRMKSARVVFPPLTISGGVLTSIAGSPHLHHFAGGPYTLLTDMTLAGAVEKGNFFSYSLDAELLGSGNLTLSAKTNEDAVVYVTSTNRNYTGKVTITNEKTPADASQGTIVSIADAYSLGGPLPSSAWNGVALYKYSLIRPQKTMTLDAGNRGIGIAATAAGFDVPEGVTLTVKQRLRLNPNSSSTLLKEGAGTLVIAGEVKHGYAATNLVDGTNNRMRVDEGFIRAVNTNSYSTLRISFAADAGVEVDPESTGDVASYGIYCPRAFEPVEVGGKVLVRPVPTFEVGDAPKFAAVVCTVASSLPDLKATLKPASIEGYTGRIEKDAATYAAEGLVTYTAMWTKTGFTVIFR